MLRLIAVHTARVNGVVQNNRQQRAGDDKVVRANASEALPIEELGETLLEIEAKKLTSRMIARWLALDCRSIDAGSSAIRTDAL